MTEDARSAGPPSKGPYASEPLYGSKPLSASDALPPVEPPSAGFILQLFVVPGIIVVIIIGVWLVFNWVARTGNDPQEYIQSLRRDNASRWQAAVNLANALRNDDAQSQALRQDTKLAQELAAILEEEINGQSMKQEPLALRIFLSQALGEFHVPDGLPVLLKAASTQRSEEEAEVQLAALRAIALLSENLQVEKRTEALDAPEISQTLLADSRDSDPRLRSAAAYAMGVIGSGPLAARLAEMLADPYPDVRYNAATWLAQQGDARAVPVLAEMLDPAEQAGVEAEKSTDSRSYKRAMLVSNGLRATALLAKKSAQVDLSPITQNIEQLIQEKDPKKKLDDQLRVQAIEVLNQLKTPQLETHSR